MDPYMFAVLGRAAQEERDRAASHTWYLNEAMAERAAARRSRRRMAVRTIVGRLRRHAADARIPASARG